MTTTKGESMDATDATTSFEARWTEIVDDVVQAIADHHPTPNEFTAGFALAESPDCDDEVRIAIYPLEEGTLRWAIEMAMEMLSEAR